MESEARPQVIVAKTEAQLDQQTRLVNLHPRGWRREGLPKELFGDPQVFKQDLKNYREYIEKKKVEHGSRYEPPPNHWTEPYRKYEEYLKALREIRKGQSSYIDKQMDKHPTQDSRVETYLEVAKYSPDLGKKLLVEINQTVDRGEPYVFTPQEVDQGSVSESAFYSTVDKALNKKPTIIYDIFRDLKYALPQEKIKEAVVRVGPNHSFMDHYTDLKRLFSPEEQKAFIAPFINEGRYGHEIVQMFRDPEANALFTPDQVKAAVMNAFEHNVLVTTMEAQIKHYLENGILTPDDVQTIILERVKGFEQLIKIDSLFPLLPNPQSLGAVKKTIVDTYATKGTVSDLTSLPFVAEYLTPEQRLHVVREVVLRDKFKSGFNIDTCINLAGAEQFAPILKQVIYSEDIPLTGFGVGAILQARCLTTEEKEAFIDHLIDLDKKGQLEDQNVLLDRARTSLFSIEDEKKRDEIALKIFKNSDPAEVARKYSGSDGWGPAVSVKVVKELISEANFQTVDSWFYNNLDDWGRRIHQDDPTFVPELLERFKETNTVSLMYTLDNVLPYISAEKRQGYVNELIHANPFGAVAVLQEKPDIFQIFGVNLSAQQILDAGQNDSARLSYAPKSLRELYRQFSAQLPIEEQKTVVMEGYNLYRAISLIKPQGLEDDFRRVQASRDIPLSAEKELVSTIYCFGLLKATTPELFAQIGPLGNTPEESKQILFNQFSHLLGFDRQFNPDEVSRFFGTMETPVPFMIYLLQHRNSASHRKLLTGIFESITTGKFNEWKFGPVTQESLDLLKQAKLLPEKLTLEQYTAWRSDGQTTLFESLATDTETTANAVKGYLEDNLNHLEIQEVLDHLMEAYPNQDMMAGLQQEISSLGQQLALTNKELGSLRKIEDPANNERLPQLEQAKIEFEGRRQALLRARKMFRLADLKPEEVASGYLMEGKDGKQRGDSITKVLEDLKKSSSDENGFVYDEIRNMLDALKGSTGEKQNLVATDSSDPKVWIEIGEKPVSSCQNYDGGSYNECLVAYTDPNTKFLILRNQRGKIIARSVFRLLETSNGDPALHIERIYSASTSKGVLRSMFARAYQKAEEMNLPLLVSEQSQDEGGIEKETQLAEGYQNKKVDYSLVSKASRAPKVYVDSAGGVSSDGNFIIRDLLRVQKTT